jgi:hypothetical protein
LEIVEVFICKIEMLGLICNWMGLGVKSRRNWTTG